MAFFEWWEGGTVKDLVGTRVLEPVEALDGDYVSEPVSEYHGPHCYVEDAGYAVLVCGWPDEHVNRSPING